MTETKKRRLRALIRRCSKLSVAIEREFPGETELWWGVDESGYALSHREDDEE